MAEDKKTGQSRPSTAYAQISSDRKSSRPPPADNTPPVNPLPTNAPRPATLRAPSGGTHKETLRIPDRPASQTSPNHPFKETLQGISPSDVPPAPAKRPLLEEEATRLYAAPPNLPTDLDDDDDDQKTSIASASLAVTPAPPPTAPLRQPQPHTRAEALRATTRFDAPPESVRVVDGASLADWQQVWLATQSRKWTSLCLLPANRLEGDLLMKVANALRQIGVEHLKQPLTVLDHRGVTLRDVEKRMESVSATRGVGGKVLVVLDAIERSTVSARYAKVIDAAILVVILGESEIGAATKTVETFGKDRFLGTLVIRPEMAQARQAVQPAPPAGAAETAPAPKKKRSFLSFLSVKRGKS